MTSVFGRIGLLSAAVTTLAVLPMAAAVRPAAALAPAPSTQIVVPAWATPANLVGAADPAATLELRLWLGWTDQAGAVALGHALSDPASPDYGKYVTSADFLQRFAPSAADVFAVQSWATAASFTLAEVPTSRLYVGVKGTVAQAAAAFHTVLDTYHVQGLTLRAPAVAPVVPAALNGRVRDVIGLDQSSSLVHTNRIASEAAAPFAAPPPAFVNAPACSTYAGEIPATGTPAVYGATANYVVCGNTPQTLRKAYGLDSAIAGGITGKGQTVVIIDAWSSPTILSDANTWSTKHGVPQFATGQYTDASPPGLSQAPEGPGAIPPILDPQGWSGEETLDVEAVHGMAPGANVVFVGGVSPEGPALEVAMLQAVEQHLGDEISNSYGFAGEGAATEFGDIYKQILTMAQSTGIGVYFSSGDNGDEVVNTGTRQPDYPASDPLVTAVGGTSLELAKDGSVGLETGWGTSKSLLTAGVWTPPAPGNYIYGGGGGTSSQFAQPDYQKGVVPTSISQYGGAAAPMRAVPDISADGDPNTGLIIGQQQTFPDGTVAYGEFRLGGTSLSCPLMAGMMALVGQSIGKPVGFANPALYAMSTSHSAAIRDVLPLSGPHGEVRNDYASGTSGAVNTSLRSFGTVGSLHIQAGYSDVTGIGTPNGALFLTLGNQPGGNVPEAPIAPLMVVAGVLVAAIAVAIRRRRAF
jgi:subtilase family serine protease